jgi:regulation of enolase protein 1 (concanavalin A-like superfamily)
MQRSPSPDLMSDAPGLTIETRDGPLAFEWAKPPRSWDLAPDGALAIDAGARTDLFIDPGGARSPILDAPRLLAGPIHGDFLLSARVTVDFAATFDAGVLLIWADDVSWAKLCFEYSPRSEPTIVSVVTRGTSDDCNSFLVDGTVTWLRIGRVGSAYAFHVSTDGRAWQLVRHFALAENTGVSIGLLAQSPTGGGCTVRFDRISFEARALTDLRSGE